MKKIFMAAMTLVMAVFTACTNEDIIVENNEVKVNFTVADKTGFDTDTRAVKNGWGNNDEILIVFQGQDGSWLDFSNNQNFLKLIKTADGWSIDKTKCPETSSLSSGKGFFAIHHPGTMEFGDKSGTVTYLTSYLSGYEYLSYQGTYTISEDVISLGTITMKRPSSSFQISVKITDGTENSDYKMSLYNKANSLKHNQCLYNLYVLPSVTFQISGQDAYDATAVTIGTDKVFNFRGYKAETEIEWISVARTNGTFYYKLSEAKTISDLQGKAWILPELKVNGSNEIEVGCQWKKSMNEEE